MFPLARFKLRGGDRVCTFAPAFHLPLYSVLISWKSMVLLYVALVRGIVKDSHSTKLGVATLALSKASHNVRGRVTDHC